MPSSLLLSLQYAEELSPTIRAEFESLFQALQTWAGKIQAADGNIVSEGLGTFLGQPRCRVYKLTAQSIPNNANTELTWDVVATGNPLVFYDDGQMFDGDKYILCQEPGLYIAHVEMQWAQTANLGDRLLGISLKLHPENLALDTIAVARTTAVANGNYRQTLSVPFPVLKDHPLGPTIAPCPVLAGVQVWQDSGAPLNVVGSAYFSVIKVG